ncbi:hypothetical protein EFD56_21335 [Rhizobium phaseoli]|uniref:hypothetical protein n=1 Tax=Rhizobium phaseoli TaxID=396 RepID=UPI000F862C8C|nr:hypothetical protein [Rhizobium phaseoli]RUM16863.1 hypothetical protein EFD56_21335 [Rhizobium phaseoli]
MTSTILLTAAIMTFGAIMWVMLAGMGMRTDIMKTPPSFHARQAKLILPLMALFVVLVLLASQAKSWGWP